MRSLPALDIRTNINHSPHVVILGAGASVAAFPRGDANGRKPPLMKNLINLVGLTSALRDAGFRPEGIDFEALYDELASSGRHSELVAEIKTKTREYFAGMRLPSEVTIYDCLLLSLRKKDLIATFNWDPFLAQAYRRNIPFTDELPQYAFLHGNVEAGACVEHKRKGFVEQQCSICRKELTPTGLLYPVKHKDYNRDPFIAGEWETLRSRLNHAYCVTIYGYSAPVTDIEAKSLMLEVWKDNPTLELANVEIIDIEKKEELEKTWKEFLFEHHYGIRGDIFDSYLFTHPRRSCEAFAMATLQNSPWHDNKYPRFDRLNDLHQWLAPLIKEEDAGGFSGKPCLIS